MTDNFSIESEVKAAYQKYIDLLNIENIVEIVKCYAYPCTFITDAQGMIVLKNEEEVMNVLKYIMNVLHQQDWGHTEINTMQVWPLSPTLAQLSVEATRYKKDASFLEKIKNSYIIRREDDNWKILVVIPIEKPFTGPTNH